MKEYYKVREDKKIRVIIDTDAACEADDQFAIAQALMTQKFIVKGIVSEHCGVWENEDTENMSYEEVKKVLKLMGREDIPVFHGSRYPIFDVEKPHTSEGIEFIINEANAKSDYPLYVLCQGAVTNVGCALLKCPEIASKMTVISILGGGYPDGGGEFNLQNDFRAANVLFSSGVELWQVPNVAYARMRTSYAELQEKVRPYGKIGRYLFDNMQEYGNSEKAGWTMGESWSLGDSPAVGLAMDFCCGKFSYKNSPIANQNGNYVGFNENKIRVYDEVDSRFILEDFFAKLKFFYKSEENL